MQKDSTPTLDQIREQLLRSPAPVLEEFEAASRAMPKGMTEAQTSMWAQSGLDIARQTARSWEAAAQYYKASPKVLASMPFNHFMKWAECGGVLCKESPTLATAYFEASPGTVARLSSRHIESWSRLGGGFYKGTWKSSTFACKFFSATPALLKSLTFQELKLFAAFLETLSHRSYDLSAECLTLGQRLFKMIGDDKTAFMSLASTLAETSWREVKSFFDAGSKALPRIEAAQRLRFLTLAERLVRTGATNIPTVMLEISEALGKLESVHHGPILALSESLLETSHQAVPEFIKGCPRVLDRLTMSQTERWFKAGVDILKQNADGGMAYFRIESVQSEEAIEALSAVVEFSRVKDVMEMYCRALAGEKIKLALAEELAGKNIGWVSNESPSTEGSTIFAPPIVDRYSSKEENFSWFKVVSTHQVAHLEFGSFRFQFDEPSTLFKDDLRPELEKRRLEAAEAYRGLAEEETLRQGWVTDVQRFFNLFEDRKLALDIFTVIEDGRLDARVKFVYAGIRQAYSRVQADSLGERPEIESMPIRQAMVELLVRLSLKQPKGLRAPSGCAEEARTVIRIARRVLRPDATVADVAEATLRVYAILSGIPNEEASPDQWEEMDVEDEDDYVDSDDIQLLLDQIAQGLDLASRPEDEKEYESTEDVEYRGDFKPELVQLLTQLRSQNGEQAGETGAEPITQEQLEELLKNSAELDLQAAQGDVQTSSGLFASNILQEAGATPPQSSEAGQGPFVHVDEDGGSLDPTEPQTFVYDEWDFRAEDYKPRWCIVRQKTMAEGEANYFGMTLHNYGPLVGQIRRQFERMVPEMFRKIRRLEDGEDIDIDDLIEAMVDIRTGVTPSDKFYWRRNKVQRDVAVAFLLDTSASTAEAIDEAKRVPEDWDAPDDPVEYMVWLRTRRGETMRRSYKRIIDVEKEAIVLLVNALEAIGDLYGIYGFSGYGRENVEFYTIKDLDEVFSDRVKKRIDRIAPLHATRMGPAIRHATSKLESQDARTKLLFLISDGRPQDRGYSREGVEKEYAVHDTKMALDEAKHKDINAFCLTVDKNGHDYLKTMCQDIGYEVLDDVFALPERLLFLYKRLTM